MTYEEFRLWDTLRLLERPTPSVDRIMDIFRIPRAIAEAARETKERQRLEVLAAYAADNKQAILDWNPSV